MTLRNDPQERWWFRTTICAMIGHREQGSLIKRAVSEPGRHHQALRVYPQNMVPRSFAILTDRKARVDALVAPYPASLLRFLASAENDA